MAAKTYKTEEGFEYIKAERRVADLIIDLAIQPRVKGIIQAHVKKLSDIAAENDNPFTVDVVATPNGDFVTDGIHRVNALRNLRHLGAKFQKVKVRLFEGDYAFAMTLAAQSNKFTNLDMDDDDRRKALFNLLAYAPEWREKSARHVGAAVGLSGSTALKHFDSWHEINKVPPTDFYVSTDGRKYPRKNFARASKDRRIRKSKGRDGYCTSINNKKVYIAASNETEAKDILDDIFRQKEIVSQSYREAAKVANLLRTRGITAIRIDFPGANLGLTGYYWRGHAITTAVIESPADCLKAVGMAVLAKNQSNATRVVVLCPGFAAAAAIVALAEKLGIEFMTIDEFAASVADQIETETESSDEASA